MEVVTVTAGVAAFAAVVAVVELATATVDAVAVIVVADATAVFDAATVVVIAPVDTSTARPVWHFGPRWSSQRSESSSRR